MLSQPEFRNQRCTRYRYRYDKCQLCSDACPHGAVALSDEGITISPATCQNCSLCVAACPTEALVADNPPRIELLKRAVQKKAVTFACAPSQLPGDEVIPCLGTLDAVMLAFLASRGVAVSLAGTQHCAQCPHGARGKDRLDRHLEATALLRETVGLDQWASITLLSDAPDATQNNVDHNPARRHLFRRFIGRNMDQLGYAAADQPPVPLKAIRIAAPVSSEGRELLQHLFDIQPDKQSTLAAHSAIHAARLLMEPGCTACEACVRVCPTGALQIRESTAAWELVFRFPRCVGCGACLEVCQPRVLRYQEEMESLSKAPAPILLHALNKQRCSRCERFFISPAPQEVCQICQGDDEDFGAIFG